MAYLLANYVPIKVRVEMEEFQRQVANGFIIERVNLTQATISEAGRFRKHLETWR